MKSTSKPNSVTGLVVSVIDQGEKDKLAVLVTENGKFFVNFRGVRSQNAKLKRFAAPYVFADFTLQGSTVTGARLFDSHLGLFGDVKRAAAAAMIAESLVKCAEFGSDLKRELTLALVALKTAERAETFPYTAALWFFLKLLSLEGADTEDYPFPPSVKESLRAIALCEAGELDALELCEADVLLRLSDAANVFYSAFGIRFKSVTEAIKLISFL